MADALDAWLETRSPTWAASTVRDQASRVSLVRADRIARAPLGRLTVADVDRWHGRLCAQGVGESSIRNQHLVLRAALSQAARWGWVATNVAALATLGRRAPPPRSAMSAAEVRAVIEAAARLNPAAGVAFRLAAVTGARRAELCALVCADLDGDRLTIDSSIAIERSGSISDRQVPALVDAATKTGNQRVVRLDPQTVAAIRALWSLSEWWGPWMLTPDERPLNPERLTSWWRLARRDAGLDPRWRLHDLRHWSATEAIGRGHDTAIEAFHRAGNAGGLALTLANLTVFLDDIDQPLIAATIHGASTRYPAINTMTKLSSTVEHLRLVLGETDFARCIAAGADMEPAEAARYARQHIEMLGGQPSTPSAPAPR